jgi:dipeptidyl aminopeptidase/acylaminoacyl peptidase
MGIAGESFGGFETNYIITKTNRFKTAVSGVSIGDVTSSYFSYNINFLRPNMEVYRPKL